MLGIYRDDYKILIFSFVNMVNKFHVINISCIPLINSAFL